MKPILFPDYIYYNLADTYVREVDIGKRYLNNRFVEVLHYGPRFKVRELEKHERIHRNT